MPKGRKRERLQRLGKTTNAPRKQMVSSKQKARKEEEQVRREMGQQVTTPPKKSLACDKSKNVDDSQ